MRLNPNPMAYVWGRLEELLRKAPPPSSSMRPLPTATQGYQSRATMVGYARRTPYPPRPSMPPELEARQARAQRLRRPRTKLERPELHRNHQHQEHTLELIEVVSDYILDGASIPTTLLEASPFERWVVAAMVPSIERDIEPHQWHKQWRANDIRVELGLEPRSVG